MNRNRTESGAPTAGSPAGRRSAGLTRGVPSRSEMDWQPGRPRRFGAQALLVFSVLTAGWIFMSGCQTRVAGLPVRDPERLMPRVFLPDSQPNAARGGALFASHCAVCHGPDGRGSTISGTPDFADAGWSWNRMPMHIYEVVYWGVDSDEGDEWGTAEGFSDPAGFEAGGVPSDETKAGPATGGLEVITVGTDQVVSHPSFRDQLRPHEVWDIVTFVWQLSLKQEATPDGRLAAPIRETFLRNCATCHGKEGFGDGPNSARLIPPPRNFHRQDFMAEVTNERLFTSISDGRPDTAMPPWKQFGLDEETRRILVDYVRTFCYPPEQRP